MDKTISKKERDYILFNIRGFFKHYKIEQNINKISIDISNLKKLQEEMNNLLNVLNECKEEFNNIVCYNNQVNRTKLLVNKKHKLFTKSTDRATKKLVENIQKIKLKDLKNDLNKSNLISRPKTPDISQIFNKYKKKKYNTIIENKSNQNINNKNINKIGSNSFIHSKKYLSKNILNNVNYFNNKTNSNLINNNFNKTQIKENKDNSFDKEKEIQAFNYTMTKFPTEYRKMIKQKNIKKININNKIDINDLSPNKNNNKKENKKDKNEHIKNKNKEINKENDNINKSNKYKKIKKINIINNYILNERFHSSDTNERKTNNEPKNNKINKKINKKIFKLDLKNRIKVKTPSPLNYRQSSPLLIDHDTIMRNKNKKINYNGNYYNDHFHNKPFKKKISANNLQKNNNKILKKSNKNINKKDITKEEEKKLDEHIINTTLNADNDTQINNTKNIMDISQNILQNLEYINNMDINKSEGNINFTNLSDINNSNINSKKKLPLILKKNRDNLFMSNYIESLYLSIKLGFFSPWDKLKLLLISKELNFKFDIKDIINDFIIYYEKQIFSINNKINKFELNLINKPFTPRKTGLNSLNFITKNEEQRLISEKQHIYVIKIFKIILILLNEYNSSIFNDEETENTSKIFEYLFNDIYNKNNVNNIKDLFIKNFVDKIPLISDTQFNMIHKIVNEIPELLSPSTLLSYNRNVSYLTFFLSELYNYLTFKTNDDVYYYKIRNEYSMLNQYIQKINNLKAYLS